jgi:hypothetical protein
MMSSQPKIDKDRMSDRETLIARKHSVRRQLERTQRELEVLRTQTPLPARRIARLETQAEQLMAEEYTLRLAIDQTRS